MTTLFVFGLGYSARAVVRRMRPQLSAVWGTTRDAGAMAGIEALGVVPLLFDGGGQLPSPSPSPSPQGGGERAFPPPLRGRVREGGKAIPSALKKTDLLLVSIPPNELGDPVLTHFRAPLAASPPRAIVYLSTVGVYGDHEGAWVDEASACRPVSKRARQRLDAENAWRGFADETGAPLAIVRLAGIYGPGRGPFQKVRSGTARRIVKPGQVFNRIHVDDIAAIVAAAFAARADGIFNGVDDEPAPPEDVLTHAAELIGAPLPPEIAFEDAEMSPMAKSFYGESKRVRNDRIKDALGVRLIHPSYREGLAAVLAAEREGRSERHGDG